MKEYKNVSDVKETVVKHIKEAANKMDQSDVFSAVETCTDEKTAKKILCGPKDPYPLKTANRYKQDGRWTRIPAIGHQIFIQNITGICRTGIVIDVRDGIVFAVEENTEGCMERHQYKTDDESIAGYGMPRYDLAIGVAFGG